MKYRTLFFICAWMIIMYAIVFILTSCGATSAVRRHNRIVKNFPMVHKTDTIWKVDTIKIEKSSKDTLFYFNQKDTLIIREGQLRMKYFYHDSMVYLKGECVDTSVVHKYFTTNKYSEKPSFFETNKIYFIIGIVFFLILALLIAVLKLMK